MRKTLLLLFLILASAAGLVPMQATRTTEIHGRLGGIRAIVMIEGDVELSVDLEQARFLEVNPDRRCGVLELPQPRPSRPRVDHQRSRIVRVNRIALWCILPGEAGESKVIATALREAEAAMFLAADTPAMVDQARQHARRSLDQFFAKAGWQVEVVWRHDAP